VDELEGRFDVPGQSARRSARAVMAMISGLLAASLSVSACGQAPGTPVASSDPTTAGTGSVTDTSHIVRATATPPPLTATARCPLTAALVSSITGVRVYERASIPSGSCVFDSKAGGTGLGPSEVRVVVQTGTDDLGSLYSYFSQQRAGGLPSCQPFRLLRRPDLGPGAFETLCGAASSAPTSSGPASADDYLPLQDHRQLTVTVNRGVAVRDHRLVTCEAQTAAIVKQIAASW